MQLRKTAGLAALITTALLCSTPIQAADITLKLGHLANEENSWHKGALKFADEVKALTNGKVEVKVFANDLDSTVISAHGAVFIRTLVLGIADGTGFLRIDGKFHLSFPV